MLNSYHKIYFIGIKGVAMSGLAIICKQRGAEVAGSDVAKTFITDATLQREGIKVYEGFNAQNLDWQPDLVVIGASWGDDNIEVAEAHRRGLVCMTDSEMRGALSMEKATIAVTGTHGKTTTTALMSYICSIAGAQPSFLIGTGTVRDFGANARWDSGKHFIVEGDEYFKSQTDRTPKFLDLHPLISIITSLEWEHVDAFRDLGVMEDAFSKLIEKTSKRVVACGDWSSIRKIIAGYSEKVVTYGIDAANDWQVTDIAIDHAWTSFTLMRHGKLFDAFRVHLSGAHNALNAAACIIVALELGISVGDCKKALENFSGTQRRFDVIEQGLTTWIDDYGHHPTEIRVTLEAVRQRFPTKKIWCVFQSHTASRTKALLKDFTTSFQSVDKVFIVDIFTSAREGSGDITSEQLTQAIAQHHPFVVYSGSIQQTIDRLSHEALDNVIVVTMGAGDVYMVRDHFLQSKN
jgi:UDP-N-acetylmuramate--alanine ligase